MGCAGSKESDKTAAGTRDVKEKYADMAEDAASMLSGSGMEVVVLGLDWSRQRCCCHWSVL